MGIGLLFVSQQAAEKWAKDIKLRGSMMKKIATLASATILMVAAGQASAVAVDIATTGGVSQVGIPDAVSGVGSGDVSGDTLTFDLTSTVDIGFASAVVESSGVYIVGGDSVSNVASCTGDNIICGSVAIGESNVSFDVPLALSETDVTTFTTGGADPITWTVTPEGGGGPAPVVPIPAAAWLFGSALVGLVGARRRKTS